MKTNDIKKLIYKQNPMATFNMCRGGTLYYYSTISSNRTEENPILSYANIFFEIPISDIGTTDFYAEMTAKHLLRWIVNE